MIVLTYRSHINKDLCEDVKSLVINPAKGDEEKNVEVSNYNYKKYF